MDSFRLNRQQTGINNFLLSLIVLFLGVEYFGYEGIITVYRLIILPASICIILNNTLGSILKRPGGGALFLLVAILAYITISTVLLSGTLGIISALSFLLIIPFLLAIGSGFIFNAPICFSKLFLMWGFPHILAFFILPDAYQGWSQRFVGLHYDSNFCGMYLTASFLAAVTIVMKERSIGWKLLAGMFLFFDAYLIMKTQSRTTLITCLLGVGMLVLFFTKKTIVRVVITISGLVFILFLWGYAQTLDKFAGAYDNAIDNYLVRFSSKNLERGSGREDRYFINLNNIWENGMLMPIGYAEVDTTSGSGVSFSHSSWVDILLAAGGVEGALFLVFVNGCAVVVVVRSLRGDFSTDRLLVNAICIELWAYSFLFSMITGKLFWLAVGGICISAFCSSSKSYLPREAN